METKYNDIYVPNLDEPAELEQYIRDLMTKVDKTMHDIELCVDTKLPKPIIKELTRLRCELIAVMTEVRKMGCIVHADQISVGEMLLRVKRVEIKVDELNKEVDALKVDVEKNTEHLNEHDSTLEAHEDKLTTYKRYLDRHKKQISELRADLTKCTDDLKALTDRVDGHDTTIEVIQTALGIHEETLDEHASAINALNSGVGELDNRCSTVEQKVETLEECCGEVKDTITTMNHGIGELDNRTTQNETNIAENANKIEENLHKIQQILGVESPEGITSISVLQKLVDQFTNQVTENTNNITGITTRVETNERDISNLKTTSDGLRENVDSLREDVDRNSVDIGDITTGVEQITQLISTTSEELDKIKAGFEYYYTDTGSENLYKTVFSYLKAELNEIRTKLEEIQPIRLLTYHTNTFRIFSGNFNFTAIAGGEVIVVNIVNLLRSYSATLAYINEPLEITLKITQDIDDGIELSSGDVITANLEAENNFPDYLFIAGMTSIGLSAVVGNRESSFKSSARFNPIIHYPNASTASNYMIEFNNGILVGPTPSTGRVITYYLSIKFNSSIYN